jgi:hypothetical protein
MCQRREAALARLLEGGADLEIALSRRVRLAYQTWGLSGWLSWWWFEAHPVSLALHEGFHLVYDVSIGIRFGSIWRECGCVCVNLWCGVLVLLLLLTLRRLI